MSLNAKKMTEDYVGRTGKWTAANGLKVPVIVQDAKVVYGFISLAIQPVNGDGVAWVSLGKVVLDPPHRQGFAQSPQRI